MFFVVLSLFRPFKSSSSGSKGRQGRWGTNAKRRTFNAPDGHWAAVKREVNNIWLNIRFVTRGLAWKILIPTYNLVHMTMLGLT